MKLYSVRVLMVLMLAMLFVIKGSWADNTGGVPAQSPSGNATGTEPLQLETGFGFENLSTGNTWREYYISGSQVLGKHTGIYGTARDTNRFNIEDHEVLIGGYAPLGPQTELAVEASDSTGHVLPEYAIGGSLTQAIGGGNDIVVGYKFRQYTPTGVNTENFTLEHYFADNVRIAYTINFDQLTQTGGGSATSHALALSYYYNAHNTFNLVFVLGNEVDSIGPGAVQVLNVRGASLYGIHWFTSDFAVTYGYEVIDESPAYTRNGPRLGFRFRF